MPYVEQKLITILSVKMPHSKCTKVETISKFSDSYAGINGKAFSKPLISILKILLDIFYCFLFVMSLLNSPDSQPAHIHKQGTNNNTVCYCCCTNVFWY